jgi:uncharacterized membrane protein
MPEGLWILFVHFIFLWGSVALGLAAGWRLPLPVWAASILGILIWFCGLLLNLSTISRQRREIRRQAYRQGGRINFPRIAARTLMNLGICVGFRSWFTLVVSILLLPLYVAAAHQRRRYLDYLRTGMLDEAFPSRRQPRA